MEHWVKQLVNFEYNLPIKCSTLSVDNCKFKVKNKETRPL